MLVNGGIISRSSRQVRRSFAGVVFRGDGEPKTPELMVRRLAEDGTGIEADNYSLVE